MLLNPVRAVATLLLALVLSPALADSDPPGRVGRLGLIENGAEFRVDRNAPPMPATANWPLSSGALLVTGPVGRVEAWVGSTAYRLAPGSEVEFPAIDDARVDVRVRRGSLTVSVLDRDQADDIVVDTPEGHVRFITPGRYRIDVDDERSALRVQAGRAVFDDGRQAFQVTAGQRYAQWDDGDSGLDAERGADDFDRWVAGREAGTYAATARRHVSPHMTGYQDLDLWGDWRSEPEYGTVWYPRAVADDWAPYRQGRWAWIEPWGWTWIDQAPWGFAPFHYGRWVMVGSRWAWVPGRPAARPVYAPALVGWLGDPGWRVRFGFGPAPAVGWFPLAPREVYVPPHRHSPEYVRRINVMHVRDANVIERTLRDHAEPHFAYRESPRAVTVVPVERLRGGQPISPREISRRIGREAERAPPVSRAPSADWLAPAPRARHPAAEGRDAREHRDERRYSERDRREAFPPGAPAISGQPAERFPAVDIRQERRRADESGAREVPGAAVTWPSPMPASPRAVPEMPRGGREQAPGRDAGPARELPDRAVDIRHPRRDELPGAGRESRERAPSAPGLPESRPGAPRDAGRDVLQGPSRTGPGVEQRFGTRQEAPRESRPDARAGEGRRPGRDDGGRERGGH